MENPFLFISNQPKKILILFLFILIIFIFSIFILLYIGGSKIKTDQNITQTKNPVPTSKAVSIPLTTSNESTPSNVFVSPQTITLFPPEQKIAQAGKETIYGKDLNYIINKRYAIGVVETMGKDEVKKRAIDDAIQDSIILQEESTKDNSPLSSSIFNNPNKNNDIREKIISEYKSKQLELEEKISGAFISVWYHNVRPPSIPLVEAKQFALEKITNVYNDLKTGSITFQQAGEILRNDTTLSKIDQSYRSNAYFEFIDHPKTQKSIVYDLLEKRLWELKEGEMTEIIQYPDPSIPLGTNEEEFFCIIKVYKRTNNGNEDYKGWLENVKQKYEISIF